MCAKLPNPIPFQLHEGKLTLPMMLMAVAAALLDVMVQCFCKNKTHSKWTSKLLSIWLLLWQ